MIEQPITATVEATATGAQVRVWSVLVVAAPGVGPGRQVWRTVTLDMVDAGGRWLVDGWTSTPGPSPAPPAEGAVRRRRRVRGAARLAARVAVRRRQGRVERCGRSRTR